MIIGVIGDRGSGKTLFMTYEAFNHYRKNRQVYSNYKLTFPKMEKCLKPQLIKNDFFINFQKYNFKNVSLFIDEIYIYIDSRCSLGKKNRLMSYFFNQTRKTGVDLYYSTQFFSQVDMRLRYNTEIFVVPKKIKTKEGKIIIKIDIYNRDMKLLKQFGLKAELIFALYDTDEIIRFDDETTKE